MRGAAPLANARYERLGVLASGGMAKVYLGRARIGDAVHTVAIKVLHQHLAREADMVAMFLDEARVSIKIRHPNIVHVWDVDLIGEELVIVMEYVEGATLSHLLRAERQRGACIPAGVAARILQDALTGLHAAHELIDEDSVPMGLVHRDVSPQNLLVGADGITRVADFGVALSTGRLAQTQGETVKGKLRYLAPEQVLRRPLDRRVDIFSAGVVLWEALTGKHLFDGGTEAETLTQVMREAITPPSSHRPDLPPELDEVTLRALERDPDRRFSTAAQFAAALKDALGPKLAEPPEVGAVVMDIASEAILRHRLTLEHKQPFVDDPSAAEIEISAHLAQPGRASAARIALVAVLCLLIGGTAVKFASRQPAPAEPEHREPSASESKADAAAPVATETTPPATTTAAEPPPSASVSAASTPPARPSARPGTAVVAPGRPVSPPPQRPVRPPPTTPHKPQGGSGGDTFMPPEL